MEALTGIQFTKDHIRILDDAIEEFDRAVLERGRLLWLSGAVKSLFWLPGTRAFNATVRGSRLYYLQISVDDESVSSECSCPFGYNCKHSAAVVLELFERARQQLGSSPAAVPKSPVEEVKVDGPVVSSERASLNEVDVAVYTQICKTLQGSALETFKQIAVWWAQKKATATSSELAKLVRQSTYWGWKQEYAALWPEEASPTSLMEYLAHLSLTLKKWQLSLPAKIEGAIDPDVRFQVSQEWDRVRQIQKWREAFGNWRDPVLVGGPQAVPELRLILGHHSASVQIRYPGETGFEKTTQKLLKQLWGPSIGPSEEPRNDLGPGSNVVLKAARTRYNELIASDIPAMSNALIWSLSQLMAHPEWRQVHVVNAKGAPLVSHTEPVRWALSSPEGPFGDYILTLRDALGAVLPRPVAILSGVPLYYVTGEAIYPLLYWPFGDIEEWPVRIPSPALESREGVAAIIKLGLAVPSRLEGRVKIVPVEVLVRCRIQERQGADYFQFHAEGRFPGTQDTSQWKGSEWSIIPPPLLNAKVVGGEILHFDRAPLVQAAKWLGQQMPKGSFASMECFWLEERVQGKDWPERITAWLDRRPKGVIVELDAELAGLREGRVAGRVRLDIEESRGGIDWFDLSVALDVSDSTLTKAEIELLLKAKGKWIRLAGKGWRKLEFQLSDEELKELAELGLAVNDFGSQKQRLHALQLGSLSQNRTSLLSSDRVEQVRLRVDEIQTRVTPSLPEGILATLRPYQMEGFHFLSYLTMNRFGGVLADDMGLGKTLQTLTWVAWLRSEKKLQGTVLVVCPKSVQDNWRSEAGRFFPTLTMEVWDRSNAGETGLKGEVDLLVIHYAQLRIYAEVLCAVEWGAVILDEAQAIKNPGSQISQAACDLKSAHRLALTGTPIENRLLDLWSIFAFAMPGVLGSRAGFTRDFDSHEDPFSRRRLAARTRPFLLRRTKNEVARDLPERVEEDITIELEGTQAALYQAEVKRARAQLLKIETNGQLDKLRFNVLTSLLRLRQICCHPMLIGLETAKSPKGGKRKPGPACESAKMVALMEMLEPLMEQGVKVLIFSQFVEMLGLLEAEILLRGWKSFKLTGQTEERGSLVSAFQEYDGSACFLISLKAGGSGLNLTAASYVILFDPWWNPAVEAQAIDRTHRIGQKQTVFAYRLIVKNSVEEKIRQLQKQKGSLATDILGEENFAKALTISDFRFLLGDA